MNDNREKLQANRKKLMENLVNEFQARVAELEIADPEYANETAEFFTG